MGIGADERVRVHAPHAIDLIGERDAGQVLEVHLVHDAGVRRDHAKVPKRGLSPAKELVALAVAIEFLFSVDQEGGIGAIFIHLNRVIDHQVHWLERIDTFRCAAEPDDRVAHGGEVDDGGDAGEVLEQHPAGAERDLVLGLSAHLPPRERFNVGGLYECVVLVAQQVLEQNAQRDRESLHGRVRQPGECAQARDRIRRPVHREG
jgi:hypothetical protein